MLDYVLNEHTMTAQNLYNHQRWHVIPEQGKLVMFPAWITHFAESNQSNEDRISFAFNAVIETKEQENKNGGK
jgi:ectoine hydroxylase-related dioxygenase (phytanoyl-CoA dioxygenase family)